jgi:hypothetical protein
MAMINRLYVLVLFTVFAAGVNVGRVLPNSSIAHAQSQSRVFEIRTYTATDGNLDALHARFRDHTMRLFEKHGMTNIGYWTPQDAPLSNNTLIYIIAHQSRDAARENWKQFQADPEWQKVRDASEAKGKIVSKVESVFVAPTDYSPVK